MKSFVPTPEFFEARAIGLWPHRWKFGIASLALFVMMFALILLQGSGGMKLPISLNLGFFRICVLASTALWGCLCIGTWFHPVHGNMRMENRWWTFLPRKMRVFVRWYASVCLVIWFIALWSGVIYCIYAAVGWRVT